MWSQLSPTTTVSIWNPDPKIYQVPPGRKMTKTVVQLTKIHITAMVRKVQCHMPTFLDVRDITSFVITIGYTRPPGLRLGTACHLLSLHLVHLVLPTCMAYTWLVQLVLNAHLMLVHFVRHAHLHGLHWIHLVLCATCIAYMLGTTRNLHSFSTRSIRCVRACIHVPGEQAPWVLGKTTKGAS